MSDTRQIYQTLKAYEHTRSIPIDVAMAAIAYHTQHLSSHRDVVTLQTVDENELNLESTVKAYKVRKHGGVIKPDDESFAFAFPIGRLDEIIDVLCDQTAYIVVERNDES